MISKTPIENFKKKFDVVSVFIECDGEILLLHRQDHKPQGNTWAMVAGKVDQSENLVQAMVRETEEEIGLVIKPEELKYFACYYLRYPDYDYLYHIYHLSLSTKPTLTINFKENKDHCWLTPKEALKMDLIPDEDSCIKWSYNID